MYMKVFAHGKGRGELATNYLVRTDYHNRDSKPPEVLRGDPDLTADLINSIERKWKYTAGVLSWSPDDTVTPEKEVELMDSFEKMAFAGLEPDQYNILWVRHTHANHHELHFVMPRMELHKGKAFNPCPPNWQKHFDPWRDYFNIKESWARPDDPERARLFTPAEADIKYNRLKRWGKEPTKSEVDNIRELLIEYTLQRIENGLITTREEIIQSFQELGLSINRKGKDYLTVHDKESNKKIRLKGGIFHETWRLGTESPTKTTGRQQESRSHHTGELARLREELTNIHEKRAKYNRERYRPTQRTQQEINQGKSENAYIQLLHDDLAISSVGSRACTGEQGNEHVYDKENQYTTERNGYNRTKHNPEQEDLRRPTNMGRRATARQEWEIHYSTPRNESSRHLDNKEQSTRYPHEITKELHERNTEIPRIHFQQNRIRSPQATECSRPKNQGVTRRGEKTESPAIQLATILSGLNSLVQRITQLLPCLIRKNKRLKTAENHEERSNYLGL